MTYSKVAESKAMINIFRYDYQTIQISIGNQLALLNHDEVRDLMDYLEEELDEY